MVEVQVKKEIIEKVREYFLSRGFQEASIDELNLKVRPDLAFTRNGDLVFVEVLEIGALSDRSLFMKALMNTSALRDYCNLLYIAAPKLLAVIIDSSTLSEYGVGLLTVGDKVLEAQPATYRPIKSVKPQQVSIEIPEIEELKKIPLIEERIRELERVIVELRSTISNLQGKIYSLSSRVESLEKLGIQVKTKIPKPEVKPEVTASVEVSSEGLPSFLKDNPWVSILSKRGEERVAA